MALLCLAPDLALAQKAAPKTRMAIVRNDAAMVYQSANFDSRVIAKLPLRKRFLIAAKPTGAFFKIKVREGLYGYIADSDIAPVPTAAEKKKQVQKKEQAREKKRRNRPFELERYRGLEFAQINFRENTMGGNQSDALLFFGAKFSGPQLASESAYTDVNLLFHSGAPAYYEKLTGRSADGFALLVDFLWQMTSPQGKNTMLFYGFGPMLRYSKWDVAVSVAGRDEVYDLTDITVGAVFNLGIAQKFDTFALRGEIQYYWEKMQYHGLAVSVQLPF